MYLDDPLETQIRLEIDFDSSEAFEVVLISILV